jgi:hypothetical protein
MTQLTIRKLTPYGSQEYSRLISEIREGNITELDYKAHIEPISLGPRSSQAILGQPVFVDLDRRFATRFELAEYLHPIVDKLNVADLFLEHGLWEWLSLIWLDQLARSDSDELEVGENARYLIVEKWKRYRHLVLGPYAIYHQYRNNPADALCVLYTKPAQPGEIVGQLGAKLSIVQSRAVVSAATKLYMSGSTPRRGAGGSGSGSPRRLNAVIEQLDRTFDLQSMDPSEFLELLPEEFDSWKTKAGIPTTKR